MASAASKGAPAARRPALKPAWAARPRRPVRAACIDCHVHWYPESYRRAFEATGQPWNPGPNPTPLDFDLDRRRAWMDRHGVRMQVLTLSGAMPWQWASHEQAAQFARLVNDAAIEAHTAFPERYVAAISLPARQPEFALRELNRVAGRPGLVAVQLPNSIAGEDYLFTQAYQPLLERCQELRLPIMLHPLDGAANVFVPGERLAGPAFINNWIGFAFEQATTATKFITSGTLDRFPKLEVLLPHAGGAFAMVAGRLQHGLEKMGRRRGLQARPLRSYLRRFHYDSLAYYPETFRFLLELLGADRIVLGTDLFSAMDVQYPAAFIEQFRMSAAERAGVLERNALRLFGL